MNFLENIFQRLVQAADRPILQEVRDGRIVSATGGEFLSSIATARVFLRKTGVKRGDRCVLLAHNSIRWAALDLAIIAEGLIAVPLYARQAPKELVGMMKDSGPALVCCGDEALCEAVSQNWTFAPPIRLFDEIFADRPPTVRNEPPASLAESDPVTIIYTSGTSGEPKGVVLNVGNLNHMLGCTTDRLDLLMGLQNEPDRVFHYLPFCFAGSWILLLTSLVRASVLTLSMDLTKLADELRLAAPDYFLNVPALLERVRRGIEEETARRGGVAAKLFARGKAAWFRPEGKRTLSDSIWLAVARTILFPIIKKKIGPNLRALICGSAPLAAETQRFFMMLGLPVLQVYGLTETTAICTMDHPHRIEPGRVGPAIAGIEMTLGEFDEIMVRGPNIFPGYWNRPQEMAKVFHDGWFRTGDQGEVDANGNWRIIGRIKNLIILSSGHNVAPEPIEEMLERALPPAQPVVLVGHGRPHLSAIVTGDITREQVTHALDRVNLELPHYKRVHAFHIEREAFTVDNGLLTANGKLKRDAIEAHFRAKIEELYRKQPA